jgi:predicted lipoprotein with Yx(FWY)xxD motif
VPDLDRPSRARSATIPLLFLAVGLAGCGGSGSLTPSAGQAPTRPASTSAVLSTAPSLTPATSGKPHRQASHRAASTSPSPSPSTTATAATSPPTHRTTSSRPAHRPSSDSPAPVPAGTVVNSWRSPKNGVILVDGTGHVLYLYTPDDATGTPTCTGSCAAAWPPLAAQGGKAQASGAVSQSKLSVVNGQVAYNGHPLYRYGGDSGPHQTHGQKSGGIWYVVSTSGNPNTN